MPPPRPPAQEYQLRQQQLLERQPLAASLSLLGVTREVHRGERTAPIGQPLAHQRGRSQRLGHVVQGSPLTLDEGQDLRRAHAIARRIRMVNVIFAFPVMLLAIGIIAMLGPRATSSTIAITIIYTPIFARLLRGPALVICEAEYVKAARAIGASPLAILVRHVVPNLASMILVQTSLLLSSAILVEASLSFLGLGAQPPTPSLGLMLAEGRNFLMLSPWSAVFAGLAILLLAFGLNLLGDALRDRLDPRLAKA